MQQPLELAVGVVEEGPHLVGLHGPEFATGPQGIDEEPVALLGRHPPRARVRLMQVALAFELHHLVAHGGRRDLDPWRVGDHGGPHRLCGGDVLLNYCSQDGSFSLLEHADCTLTLGLGVP